jgi:sigma-B regulation protein RsbU (phosphoserine phosphatase)
MGTTGMGTRKVDATTIGDLPLLVVVDGIVPHTLVINHFPFTVGRRTDRDLVMGDPRVSKEHAQLVREIDGIFLIDQASEQGTYINGERVVRRKLTCNDRIEFGTRDAAYVIFNPDRSPASTAQQLLSQVATWKSTTGAGSDVDMLNTFLKAARKLNAFGVLDEVLHILLEAALRRTHADRVFVFGRHDDGGELRLLAGRYANGEKIEGGSTISRDAASGASEYLDTITDDTGKLKEFMPPYSPDRFLCLPLCQTVFHDEDERDDNRPERPYVQGVVCLDYPSRMPSLVSYGVLKEMAEGVATLVENAALMKAENTARYVRQELTIAAGIQQRLMTVIVPDVPYAKVKAVSYACKGIGGDFFDLVHTGSGLSLIIADVSGKGVAAAVVAAILQGMLYSHLARDSSLPEMIAAVNRFLCDKVGGQKFATLVVTRLAPNGELELINCGHVPPIIVSGHTARSVEEHNLPVGLISVAHFQATRVQLNPGDRLLLVTDGVTEAENAEGEFFGTQRLEACGCEGFAAIERAVTEFRGSMPLNDDCTITEMIYRG